MKKIILSLFLSFSFFCYSFSQNTLTKSDAFSILTKNDGYWLLYSEKTEQLKNGEYLAIETFFDDNDVSSIMIEDNGTYHAVNSDYIQSKVKWELTDSLEIKIINEAPIDSYNLEIIELKEPFLSVRFCETIEDVYICKVIRYCRPEYRLPADEVERKNKEGAYPIDGFSKNQLRTK